MALEHLVAYAVLVGLPLWLVVEEVVHRFASRPKPQRATRPAVKGTAPTERRAAERAAAHFSSV
jgi:hypothetical protein